MSKITMSKQNSYENFLFINKIFNFRGMSKDFCKISLEQPIFLKLIEGGNLTMEILKSRQICENYKIHF